MAAERPKFARHGIGSAIVWVGILALARRRADPDTREKLTIVCGGWWLGWSSASIARLGSAPPTPLSPEGAKRLERISLVLVAIGLGNVARVLRPGS